MGVPNAGLKYGGFLRKNRGTQHPSNLAFAAVRSVEVKSSEQTNKSQYAFRCGSIRFARFERMATSREAIVTHRNTPDLWAAIAGHTRKRTPLHIFAHDIPELFTLFDGWNMLRRGWLGFECREVDFQSGCLPAKTARKWHGLFIDNDPPVMLQLWHRNGCKVFFCDTRNYFRNSLEELGERCGMPRGRVPSDCESAERHDRFAECDALIVQLSIESLITSHKASDYGNWAPTASGLAWRAFRHRFHHVPISLNSGDEVKKLERVGYFGGRVELFKQGTVNEPVFQLDVNGLYPWIMEIHDLPNRKTLDWTQCGNQPVAIEKLGPNCIARVLIDTVSETFPFRCEQRGLIFPLGRYWTVLCGPELMRAKTAGVIERVDRWASYWRANLFRGFVRHFRDQRSELKAADDKIGEAFAKSQLVSLYGRFGMLTPRWRDMTLCKTWVPETKGMTDAEVREWFWLTEHQNGKRLNFAHGSNGETRVMRRVGNHWQLLMAREETNSSFPAIPAFITSFAREYMLRLMRIAGRENVLYISTDSLVVNTLGCLLLARDGKLHQSNPGKLKLEAIGLSGDFHACHHYRVGKKLVRGGMSLEPIDSGDGWSQEVQRDRLETLVKHGQRGLVGLTVIEKRFDRRYDRGVVSACGDVTPLILGMECK